MLEAAKLSKFATPNEAARTARSAQKALSAPLRGDPRPGGLGLDELQEAAKRRENGQCCITGEPNPIVTNILSFKDSNGTAPMTPANLDSLQNSLQDMLSIFWPLQNMSYWRYLATAMTGYPGHCTLTEASLETVLCMSEKMAYLWQRGSFGLEPIYLSLAPSTEITLKLHWLKRGMPRHTSQSTLSKRRQSQRGVSLVLRGSNNNWGKPPTDLADMAYGGKIVRIIVKDPAKLPSLALLELRWTLSRLLAMVEEIGSTPNELR